MKMELILITKLKEVFKTGDYRTCSFFFVHNQEL